MKPHRPHDETLMFPKSSSDSVGARPIGLRLQFAFARVSISKILVIYAEQDVEDVYGD